jgi:hypothetical protein
MPGIMGTTMGTTMGRTMGGTILPFGQGRLREPWVIAHFLEKSGM